MENITILGLPWTLYEMALYFLFYSLLGWFIEVCYMTVQLGEFQNRGFLNSPICPIYGFGVLMVMVLLTPIRENILMLFFCSALLCTGLELFVGILLEKLFHNIWWDYSHEKFNYKGYICLKISVLWGIACVLMMRGLHPLIEKAVDFLPLIAGKIVIYLSLAVLLLDLIVTLSVIAKLNLRLKEIDDLSDRLRYASEKIGSNLADEVLELKAKYDKLIEQKNFAQDRMIKAFPSMQSQRYQKALEMLKEKIKFRKK